MRTDAPSSTSASGTPGSRLPSIGWPCGQVLASPIAASIRSSSTGDIACSIRSASSWTSSHGMPSTSVRNRSISRWRDTTWAAWARPLNPPIKPQLARPAKDLPEDDGWRFEPKWDGFRTIVFRDGDDVHLQSRNGRPMNRYFPEVIPDVLSLPGDRLVLDGELIVVLDGIQEFDLLGQRIHPAESRVKMLAEKTPAAFVAFDLLAEGDEELMALPFDERRVRLEQAIDGDRVQLTPMTPDREGAGAWLTGRSEGVVAKDATCPYRPGERVGMQKIKRVRTADTVVAAFRLGKEPNTGGSLILG